MARATKTEQPETGLFPRAVALLGGAKTFSYPVNTALDAHIAITSGIPAVALVSLFENVAILQRPHAIEIALGVSVRTLQRRKKQAKATGRQKGGALDRLNQEQGGRAWKFAEILGKATEVFGSQAEAEAFLERPAIGLDQHRPIDLLSTPAGVELVETHLERIKYGVYA